MIAEAATTQVAPGAATPAAATHSEGPEPMDTSESTLKKTAEPAAPSSPTTIPSPPALKADVSVSSDRTTPIMEQEVSPVEPASPGAGSAVPTAAVASPAHASSAPSSAASSPAQPSSDSSSAASTPAAAASKSGSMFIDDAAGEGDEEGEGGEDLAATKTSDDVEMSAEEEAAGLAEIKETFLAKDDSGTSPHAQAALNRQLDAQREEQDLAKLKMRFSVKSHRSLGETLAAQAAAKSSGSTAQPSLARQESTTGNGKLSVRDSILQAAEAHATLAAAKAKELRERLTGHLLGDVKPKVEEEEDDETIERKRKERAKMLAAKSLGKRHIVPTTLTRTLTSTIVRVDTTSLASPSSLSATVELQSEQTLMLDTPSLSAPLLSRQDSLTSPASLSTYPTSFGKSLSNHVGTGSGVQQQRAMLLAGRVSGKPPAGKENVPQQSGGMTSTSFAKFNEDLRRQQSVKLIRNGSFLKSSSSANSPSNLLHRTMSTMGQDGATDFSMLIETSKPSSSSSSTPAVKSNVASSMGGHVAAKKAASKGAKAFVFRVATAGEQSRDGYENEKSVPGPSALSRSGTSGSSMTTPSPAAAATPTGPVSFVSFLSNAKKSFTAGPTSGASAGGASMLMKRQNSSASLSGYEGESSAGGSSLLNKLAKKAKKA